MIETFLRKLDMGEQEARIYLACVKYGTQNIAQLVKNTSYRRSTVYFYIEKLIEKGLLTLHTKGKKKQYIPISIRTLKSRIEEEKQSLRKKQGALDAVAPLLEKIRTAKNHSMMVEHLNKKVGVRILIDKIIKEGKNIYWLGSLDMILEHIPDKQFYKLMTWRRMDQSTTSYAITDKRILNRKKYSDTTGDFRKFRFIEHDFKIPGVLVLFGDKVGLISFKEGGPSVIIIQDETIFNLVNFLFQLAWSTTPTK